MTESWLNACLTDFPPKVDNLAFIAFKPQKQPIRLIKNDSMQRFIYITTSLAILSAIGVGFFKEPVKADNYLPNLENYRQEFTDREAIVSFYTASVNETDSTPCETADMTWICPAEVNVVANNCLPFGTDVEIDGVLYQVHDRMNRKYGCEFFDVLVKTKKEAFEKGRQNLIIKIGKYVR